MLQFLQYRIFGRHKVPEGWIVVTAGNPPEYNNSVREFDIVTWDRLKRVDVEPDFDAWKEYAYSRSTHPAVTTYLEIKKADFYQVEATVDGKRFVTVRGWSDLSDMMRLYEQHGLKIDENLVGQYLQNPKIAKDFAVYYDLFNKYRSDYQVDKILAGKAEASIKERARNAKFDERLSLLGLLLDVLKAVRTELGKPGAEASKLLEKQIKSQRDALSSGRRASSMSREDQSARESLCAILEDQRAMVMKERPADAKAAFALLKEDFDRRIAVLRKSAGDAGKKLTNLFQFCREVFPDGQELLILVTELTITPHCARFVGRYGCKEYYACNKELLFYERQQEIIQKMEDISWELD